MPGLRRESTVVSDMQPGRIVSVIVSVTYSTLQTDRSKSLHKSDEPIASWPPRPDLKRVIMSAVQKSNIVLYYERERTATGHCHYCEDGTRPGTGWAGAPGEESGP